MRATSQAFFHVLEFGTVPKLVAEADLDCFSRESRII